MLKLKLKKESHQQLLVSLGIVLISLIINPSISYSQNIPKAISGTISSGDITTGTSTVKVSTTEPVICFTETDASKMIVELENSGDYQEQIDLLKQANAELEKQIGLLKDINKLQQEQLNVSKQTIESYKELLKTQKEAYEKQIENNKPSIWGKIAAAAGGLGIGVLIGLLL
jgi:hypothetical protein